MMNRCLCVLYRVFYISQYVWRSDPLCLMSTFTNVKLWDGVWTGTDVDGMGRGWGQAMRTGWDMYDVYMDGRKWGSISVSMQSADHSVG